MTSVEPEKLLVRELLYRFNDNGVLPDAKSIAESLLWRSTLVHHVRKQTSVLSFNSISYTHSRFIITFLNNDDVTDA